MSFLKSLFGKPEDPNYSAALERVESALEGWQEQEARFSACAALLMAQVAYLDSEITPAEKNKIEQVLQKHLHHSPEKASIVAGIATESALSDSIERSPLERVRKPGAKMQSS